MTFPLNASQTTTRVVLGEESIPATIGMTPDHAVCAARRKPVSPNRFGPISGRFSYLMVTQRYRR
jgi:hypothetical protein